MYTSQNNKPLHRVVGCLINPHSMCPHNLFYEQGFETRLTGFLPYPRRRESPTHSQMSLQSQHFFCSYLEIPSVGLVRVSLVVSCVDQGLFNWASWTEALETGWSNLFVISPAEDLCKIRYFKITLYFLYSWYCPSSRKFVTQVQQWRWGSKFSKR